MTQLKTLKEIKPSLYFMDGENSLKDDLRSEAREWIKELQKAEGHASELSNSIIAWIEHFFNLED